MLRLSAVILWTLATALVIANAVLFTYARGTTRSGSTDAPTAWERWQALSDAQRHEYLRSYESLAQRADARTILSEARQFGQLPPQRQALLRDLSRALTDTLDRQPPSRRRDWLRAPPRACAYLVFQAMATDDPQRLTGLAQQRRAAR